MAKGAARNTIVAAESYFGAELFAPAADEKSPIANAYLNAGTIGFFGSTTIAYGSPERNGSADLIALQSASIGRACLEARQKSVRVEKMESPVNLKTLALILLGDPSLQAVRGASEIDELSKFVDLREARRTRRIALAAAGQSAADCSGFPERKSRGDYAKLRKLVRQIARERGLAVGVDAIEVFEVIGRDNYASAMKTRDVRQRVIVATLLEKYAGKTPKEVQLT